MPVTWQGHHDAWEKRLPTFGNIWLRKHKPMTATKKAFPMQFPSLNRSS